MSTADFHDELLPQDTAEDDSSPEANAGQPVSEAEIEDALYGGDYATADRLALLRSLRDDLAARQSDDFADDDPGAVIGEIDDRIAELQGLASRTAPDNGLDTDPLAHRETLAPDSDELEELNEEETASLDAEDEWDDPEDDPEARARPVEDEP